MADLGPLGKQRDGARRTHLRIDFLQRTVAPALPGWLPGGPVLFLAEHVPGPPDLVETHSSPCLFRFGTYLSHSILDTPLEFWFSCVVLYEPANGYTELAFEVVLALSRPTPGSA